MNPFKKLKKLLFRKKKRTPNEKVAPETCCTYTLDSHIEDDIHNINVLLESIKKQKESLRFNAQQVFRHSNPGRINVSRQLTIRNLKGIEAALRARKEDLEKFVRNAQNIRDKADGIAKQQYISQKIVSAISAVTVDISDVELEKELAELLEAPSVDIQIPESGLDDELTSSFSASEMGELKELEEWAK